MGFSRELLNVSNTDFSYISFWFSNNNRNYINSSLLKSYILINVYKTIPVAFRSLFIKLLYYIRRKTKGLVFLSGYAKATCTNFSNISSSSSRRAILLHLQSSWYILGGKDRPWQNMKLVPQAQTWQHFPG